MLISLLHATRRPEAAKKCQQLWLDRAENGAQIEIITCVDADDLECQKAFPDAVISTGFDACSAWNTAAKHAKGDILVVLDDDWECPNGWDEIVISYMTNGADILHVGDKHRKDDLICHPIVSRRYYEAIGYIWHPAFRSVYCDNFFTTMAKNWGYVDATEGGTIDLGFLHANPSQNYGHEDEVARISNSKERYAEGAALMERLTKNNMVLAFTACDRVDYLTTTLESWQKTNLKLVTSVQFFVEPTEKTKAIRAVIDAFAADCPVPVITHINPEKYGVLRNPWELFSNLFDKQLATFVILGEDDFIVSPDTLDFLEFGRKNAQPKTLAVCCKNMGESANDDPSTFAYTTNFDGNIWGTWANTWRDYLKDTWDFDYSSGKADGSSAGWDWNIALRVMPKNDLCCLVPTASRSYHIGVKGVHCTEEEYTLTTTTNFVKDAYKGKYVEAGKEPIPAPKVATCNISTAGDLGDIIACLPTIMKRGEVVNLLCRDNSQTKGIVGRIPLIKALLEAQPCIAEVREWREGDAVAWESERFRSMGLHGNGDSLAGVHADCAIQLGFIPERPDFSRPWLKVKPDITWANRVVMNRTERYNNENFPWKRIVEHYGRRLAFLGTTDEHRIFQEKFGPVEHVPTANLYEAARIIAGSALYIGNQSSCMVVAEGLKHPRIQETCLWIPDCIYAQGEGPANAQHVANGACVLPDVAGSGKLTIKATMPLPEGNETPPGGWQFPGIPPHIQHPAAAVSMVRQQKPEWDRATAHEELMRYNLERIPEFFDKSRTDHSMSRFRMSMMNAGYRV